MQHETGYELNAKKDGADPRPDHKHLLTIETNGRIVQVRSGPFAVLL